GSMSFAGGIMGELRDSEMDKAHNKGNIYFEYTGPFVNEEIAAGGVAGTEMALLKNVGNEGNVETKTAKFQHAIGITKPGRDTKIENAYSKGKIYGSTTKPDGDIYAMGLGETVVTNNFYFGGTVRYKVGKLQEQIGDALANIRPGDKINIHNYCYWNSSIAPFPGYPTFNKPTATSKAVNVTTGKLSAPVSLGGKQYDNLSEALNAWVDQHNQGYLSWTAGEQPVFDWAFGYQIPDFMKYTNRREGKWLNTSDWAYEWMDKADKLNIIPYLLLNQDMTKSITRKEFSALAVELYENLKGSKVSVHMTNPFTDVDDTAVTKAYNLGIVSGVGKGLFSPDAALTREQASAMLTRGYKAVYWEGWTLKEDLTYSLHVLDTAGVVEFNDDGLISGYAKDSVYFMVKNNIISGLGNNNFGPSPRAGMGESYGTATREQAFKIAVAMIERFR
ncbi:MAG: S-layer homology domain-containing protein, partial [Clostridiaceae bacterium]|nr:S-layer homology domain-containing protein [Clostridiaceae bacterium]